MLVVSMFCATARARANHKSMGRVVTSVALLSDPGGHDILEEAVLVLGDVGEVNGISSIFAAMSVVMQCRALSAASGAQR